MNSFWFILSVIDVEGPLPIEIIPDHWFDKANAEQTVIIKEMLQSFVGSHPLPPYEYQRVETISGEPNRKSWEEKPLPNEKWRYWVINNLGGNREAKDVGTAAALLQKEIELGFHYTRFPNGMRGSGWESGASSFFHEAWLGEPAVLGISDIREIAENYHKLKAVETQHPLMIKAARRFHSLRSLPRRSELLVVGYFAIIETLIAHKPRLQESLDSINHQLQSKMVLLSKRFRHKLDHDLYFGNLSGEKIWKQLYAYRSAIAHDNSVDFNSEFKSLKNPTNVLMFLREVVKSLLLLGLEEPVFLNDLKSC